MSSAIQYDLQHDLAWVTDEAGHSVVLVLLQVAFLEKCDDQKLGPLGWPLSCMPGVVADFVIAVIAVITPSPPAWTSSAGMSTPADFPFFNDCTAAATSLRRMGWSSSVSVSVWGQFSTNGSPLAL